MIEMLDIPDDERAERTKSGALRVDNQVHWARNYLVWAGLLDGSKRGWWQLSDSGWSLPLGEQNHETAYELFKRSGPNAVTNEIRRRLTTTLTRSSRPVLSPPANLKTSNWRWRFGRRSWG